jgi:primosomal protein DnaI
MADTLKKMTFPMHAPEDYDQKSRDLYRAAADTAGVNHLRAKGIPEQVIRDNIWQVNGWLEELRLCEKCPGLKACRQKNRGYTFDLNYDGILHKDMTACKYRQALENRRVHLKNIRINDMPESLYEVSFDTIDLQSAANRSASYQRVLKKAVSASAEEKGLFLFGEMGSGKSYLAACAVNDHARRGDLCAFLSWPSFVSRMASAVRSGEYQDQMDLLDYVPFLVIDDIGAEKVTEWNRDELLFTLLSHRSENQKCTWFTSNSDLKQLEEHFSLTSGKEDRLKAKRLMERITVLAEAEALNGKDRRKSID